MRIKDPDKALEHIEAMIVLYHGTIETMEKMRVALRIAKVWPEAWDAQAKVRIVDRYDHTTMHPVAKRRPATDELVERLYRRIRKSRMIVGELTDGTRVRPLTKREFAYIKCYTDTLEDRPDEDLPG